MFWGFVAAWELGLEPDSSVMPLTPLVKVGGELLRGWQRKGAAHAAQPKA